VKTIVRSFTSYNAVAVKAIEKNIRNNITTALYENMIEEARSPPFLEHCIFVKSLQKGSYGNVFSMIFR
jgi:hypothetical protein